MLSSESKHLHYTSMQPRQPEISGVVEGARRENDVPQNILWGNTVPPNDIRTRGNGDTEAFPQAGLQRNAKSMVSWFFAKSLKLLQPDKAEEVRIEERRGQKGRVEGMKGKGGEEDFRAFPQFQICHYTTASDNLHGYWDVVVITALYQILTAGTHFTAVTTSWTFWKFLCAH